MFSSIFVYKKGGTYMMWILSLVAVLVMIGVDQWTKYWAVTQLKPISNTTVIDGFLDFTFVENRGVAFGMLSGKKWVILLMVAVIVAVLVYYFMTLPKKKEYHMVRAALILILAGAVGNVIDRIFRGYVVDFLEFTFIQWPVFNVADIYVVCGVILLCILMLFVIREDKEKKKEE